MPKWLGLALAVAVVLSVTAVGLASSGRTPSRYRADLNVKQEVPAPKSASRRAGGTFTAKLSGNSLSWKLDFRKLTGAATAAHIHLGAKGKPGPVIVPLCGPCKSPMTGTAKVTSKVISELADGKTYVNVHTAKNAAGEIRGQIR